MTRQFDMRESAQGISREDYQPDRDSTHVAIPLAIDDAPSADEAVRLAEAASKVLSNVVDQLPGVRWCTSHGEAAYALLANLTTSLEALSDLERVTVLAAAPGLARLTELLAVWVVPLHDARLAIVPGPGGYTVPGPPGAEVEQRRHVVARRATPEDLGRLGD